MASNWLAELMKKHKMIPGAAAPHAASPFPDATQSGPQATGTGFGMGVGASDNDGDEPTTGGQDMSGGKWIQDAVPASHKGLFTKKAKAAGEGVGEFASHVAAHPENYSTKTVRQANFAKTMRGITNKLKKA